MKVKLLQKPISKGRKSLYLDFYPPIIKPETGKETRREFLSLHIYAKPKNENEREHNKETKQLAESIRAKRQLEVQNGLFGFIDKSKQKASFLKYFKDQAEKRKKTDGTYGNWMSCYNYLRDFSNEKLLFSDITERFCTDFKEYLLNAKSLRRTSSRLSQNSSLSYFNKFRAAVQKAFEDGILNDNPAKRVKGIKQADTQREFLTQEELQSLADTECELPYLKKAAIFSALTGLRFSDLTKLTWSELQHSEIEGHYIRFRQKKTKGYETLPINDQARDMLDHLKENDSDVVFPELEYSAWLNQKLKDWVQKAGITKHITFHCFRHTYATLLLTLGTDLYTVSKMLGHKNIKTTEIYAKVIDEKKRDAANRIKLTLK